MTPSSIDPDILESLRQLKPRLKEKYPPVNYLGIFGSYVRGEQAPNSDLDILIDFDFSVGKISLFDYVDIQTWLSEQLGKKIDLVHRVGLKPRIGKRILAEVHEV